MSAPAPAPRPALQILLRRLAPGMWSTGDLSDEVVQELRALNQPMLHFDFRAAEGKEAVLDALGRQGGFPDYYGRNWDAAYDCLTDLEPAIVVVQGTGGLDPSTATTLAEIISDATLHWLSRDQATYVLWDGPATIEAPPLPAHGA